MRFVQATLDQLFPPDPGRLRLMAATRATIAGLGAFTFVVLLGTVAQVPVIERVLGFAIALFIAATVRDTSAGQKLVTIALGGLAACAATIAAALLVSQPIAETVFLPMLMFAIAFFTVRGPRYGSIGLVSLIAYLIAMISRQTIETLPLTLLVISVATAIAVLVRCVLMPEHPEIEIERLRGAIRHGLAQVLDLVATAVTAGSWTEELRSALQRQVGRLDETVLLAQSKLAALAHRPVGPGWRWMQLLEIELATERVARISVEEVPVTPDQRAPLFARITAIKARQANAAPTADAGRLGSALDMLGHVIAETPESEPEHPAAAPSAPTRPMAGWRPALQTAAAAALAIAVSELLLPNRWYWAAFAAFVMFQGTRSRGESIAKGVSFVAGTSGGLVAGVLLATLLGGHVWLSVAAIVIAVFLAFQAFGAAYAVMVFWITVILGLMFGMLDYFTFDVLLLRLEESAIGVASGVLVASLVLVRREEDVTREATAAFLRALRDLVGITGLMLIESKPVPELGTLVVGVEQRYRELDAVAAAQQSGFGLAHDDTLQKRVAVLGACGSWARELGTMGLDGVRIADADLAGIAGRLLERVDATLERMLDPSQGAPYPAPGNDVVRAGPDDAERKALRLLLRMDAALERLADKAAPGRVG